MSKTINIKNALELEETIFVDMRSQAEFEEDHVENSVNIPLLSNEERNFVGRVYKQESKERAVDLGFLYVSKKLPDIYQKLKELKHRYKNVVVYCFRGGMRSKSIVDLLNSVGMDIYQLEGGYKAYRNYVLESLEELSNQKKFIVLHGHTGSGKTDLLIALKDNNFGILDLEELAKNRGSVFGHIGFGKKSPSQKYFDTLIFNELKKEKKEYIFIESESKRVGNVRVPDAIYEKIENADYRVLIEDLLLNRVKRLVKQYVNCKFSTKENILESIKHLKKRISNETMEKWLNYVESDNHEELAKELLEFYYDPLYKYSIEKYKYDCKVKLDVFENGLKELIKFYSSLKKVV